MALLPSLVHLLTFALAVSGQAPITIHPITDVDEANHKGYFSDPFHVPYEGNQGIYISGTTQAYLECPGIALRPQCASVQPNPYSTGDALAQQLGPDAHICSAAGIHPFQSGSGAARRWDALVTLHVRHSRDCDGPGITGWSVIVHANPAEGSGVDTPPTHWVGDKLLIGSFEHAEDANYDGKYFRTPAGQLYLVYSKSKAGPRKRDGVAAVPMDDPRTKTPGGDTTFLLLPDEDLNSEDYRTGDSSFRLIETGNIRAIHNKFVMAYSVGAYFNRTYKLGVAYSDTFLPRQNQLYRKVRKANPDRLWGSSGREVYYLLQADQKHAGWRYVGGQVLAPGVPTVASIGPDHGWVLTFAGFRPGDAPKREGTDMYVGNHRRPFFIDIDVNVPDNMSVEQATDEQLQGWITPAHEGNAATKRSEL